MNRDINESQQSLTTDYDNEIVVRNNKRNEVVLMTENKKMEPVHKERAGAIEVSVWENEKEGKNGKFKTHNVTFSRGYKDKAGEWQNTQSLNVGDVPKLMVCLQKSYEWIISQKAEATPE